MSSGPNLKVIGSYHAQEGSLKGFLDGVSIWINKPHVVNKRLSGTKITHIFTAESKDHVDKLVDEVVAGNIECTFENNSHKTKNLEVDLKENDAKFVVVIREMLPKNTKLYPCLLESIVYDATSHSVVFKPLCFINTTANDASTQPQGGTSASTDLSYGFNFVCQEGRTSSIELLCSRGLDEDVPPSFHPSPKWLHETLACKIKQWTTMTNLSTTVKSLRLVSFDRYKKLYSQLKEKYGPDLVKNWTERTDAQKFVYEDIGIATYLLLIWEEDRLKTGRTSKQSFVDLGCGNGLLVYILSKEGHPGLGIDLKKRNIWDTFGADVRLEERPITPSSENLFPDFDWLIGNHSDELTPWIPVIAARSSYTCSYFVLPCCLHDFNRRFSMKVKGESNYRSYLTYVQTVGEACGFEVEEDTLRIPSTKRVCQIGRSRTYPPNQEEAANKRRQQFIDERCASKNHDHAKKNSSSKPETSESTSDHVSRKRLHEEDSKDENQLRSNNSKICSATVVEGFNNEEDLVEISNNCGQSTENSSNRVKNSGEFSSERDNNSSMKHKEKTLTDMSSDKMLIIGSVSDVTNEKKAWTDDFQARSSVERVRNCQKVSAQTKERVVHAVFEAVLSAEDAVTATGEDGKPWRKGGSLPLSEVAEMLNSTTRDELKSECGGVQTLLRNHHTIFQVSGGKVQLRDFSIANPWSKHRGKKARKDDQSDNVKRALCWFYTHHPDGCPRSSEKCTFAHGEAELRPRDCVKKY